MSMFALMTLTNVASEKSLRISRIGSIPCYSIFSIPSTPLITTLPRPRRLQADNLVVETDGCAARRPDHAPVRALATHALADGTRPHARRARRRQAADRPARRGVA